MLHDSMVRNSYPLLKPEIYVKISAILYEVVGKGNSKAVFNAIFTDLFTPAERIMILKRITVMYLLLKNIDYTMICKVLRVSNTTVSKLKLLLEKSDGIVPILCQMVKREDVAIFFEKLFLDLFPPGTYGTNWKSAWERKIQLKKKLTIGI